MRNNNEIQFFVFKFPVFISLPLSLTPHRWLFWFRLYNSICSFCCFNYLHMMRWTDTNVIFVMAVSCAMYGIWYVVISIGVIFFNVKTTTKSFYYFCKQIANRVEFNTFFSSFLLLRFLCWCTGFMMEKSFVFWI